VKIKCQTNTIIVIYLFITDIVYKIHIKSTN